MGYDDETGNSYTFILICLLPPLLQSRSEYILDFSKKKIIINIGTVISFVSVDIQKLMYWQ